MKLDIPQVVTFKSSVLKLQAIQKLDWQIPCRLLQSTENNLKRGINNVFHVEMFLVEMKEVKQSKKLDWMYTRYWATSLRPDHDQGCGKRRNYTILITHVSKYGIHVLFNNLCVFYLLIKQI